MASICGAIEQARFAQRQADEARTRLSERLAQALHQVLYPGVVIDLRTLPPGQPSPLSRVQTIHGRDRGTRVFRVESWPTVEANLTHPMQSAWFCEATPISERTGLVIGARSRTDKVRRPAVTLKGLLWEGWDLWNSPATPGAETLDALRHFLGHQNTVCPRHPPQTTTCKIFHPTTT